MFTPKKIHIRMTLTEEALGMMPASKEIYTKFIAANAPDAKTREQEIEENGIEEMVKQGTTVFPRLTDGTPFFWDYQIRGMFKDSMGMLKRVSGSKCSAAKNYKKLVDGLLFVEPRKIPIHMSGDFGTCQRSLRTEGPSGSRTALASSETVPAGSTIECTLILMEPSLEAYVRECLDYGVFRGLGQWRNSGKGTFTWEEIDTVRETEEPTVVPEETAIPETIEESAAEIEETAAETEEPEAVAETPEPEPIAEPAPVVEPVVEPEPVKEPEKKKRHRRTKAEIEAEKATKEEPSADELNAIADEAEAETAEEPEKKRPKDKSEFEMMLRQLMDRYLNE